MKSEEVEKYAEEHPEEVFKDEDNQYIEIDDKTYIKCAMCGNWEPIDFMVDTETTIGIGKVCEDCYGDAR